MTTSPTSQDGQLWNALRRSVDSDTGKRRRDEDSQLLVRGFDSVYSSLALLTGILDSAAQGVRDLAKPSLTDVFREGIQAAKVCARDDDDKPMPKRRQLSADSGVDDEVAALPKEAGCDVPSTKREDQNHGESCTNRDDDHDSNKNGGSGSAMDEVSKDDKLEKAKKLAASMATKASSLARELKTMKSELGLLQDRCALLEEENRRLREGFEDGLRPDDDDLVRLQLEALLAEKSKLANENATLIRENECLQQLVQYHQITSQELSASYEHAIQQGICLDFSPFAEAEGNPDEDDKGLAKSSQSPPCVPRNLARSFPELEGHREEEKM